MRIPIDLATQSEAPQLVDIEQARKLEEEAEAAAAAAAAEEVEEEEGETNEAFQQWDDDDEEDNNEASFQQWDDDDDDYDDDEAFPWDDEDGYDDDHDDDDHDGKCTFDFEDASSTDNVRWNSDDEDDDDDDEDDDDGLADSEDLHQIIDDGNNDDDFDDTTEDDFPPDVDLANQIEDPELVEIRSPTFYFHGQMPDPSGEKSTYGKYVDRDGTIYDGWWQNNHYHGYGTLFDPVDNTLFIGRFENSRMEGPGRMSYLDDGIVISGAFTASSDIVQGTMRYQSGDIYVGEIKGKLMHGRGFLYYSSGDWIALISNEFEEGSLNGAEGVIVEADGLTLHHATFISGIEENTVEIDETIGVYTLEELGLGYEDILDFALFGTNMTDPLLLTSRTFDDLNDYDMATPNWRDWDVADWFAVTSAFCLLVPFLRPVMLRRIIRFLALNILQPFLRALFHSAMVYQNRYKYW